MPLRGRSLPSSVRFCITTTEMTMTGHESASAVRDLIEEAAARLAEAGIEDARREALALLSAVLDTPRSHLLAHPEEFAPPGDRERYRAAVTRRAAHEPFAYVVGHKEFFGLDFEVSDVVLIPRPETELLVERAIDTARHLHRVATTPVNHAPSLGAANDETKPSQRGRSRGPLAVDLGTGSGAIAISIAARVGNLRLIAVDSSPEAITVASQNAERHGVADRIDFRCGDLLGVVPEAFDLLLGNLPYIPSGEIDQLMPEVSRYEPRSALDGGPDGALLTRRALWQVANRAKAPLVMLFEIGDGQGPELERYAAHLFPDAKVKVERDIAGRERLLSIWRTL